MSLLDAVRISVGNGSIARHFWETALGLQFVSEREVSSEREAWGIRHGSLRVTRLEIAPSVFPKIELIEWEGCSNQPIRDPRHPWDYGLLALRIPVSDLNARLANIAHWRCQTERTGPDEARVITPTGEQVILRQGGDAAMIAVVPSLESAKTFFRDSLTLPNGIPPRMEKRLCGAPSVDSVESLRLGTLELMEMRRSADPRPAYATESRMHVGFTGYCMLSVANAAGKTEMIHAPGGIPVELISIA